MHAQVLKEVKQPLVAEQRDDLLPGRAEVVVQLKAAALNRRDWWITQGMYPGITTPIVLGSDGAGVVLQLGESARNIWQGREVVINPGWKWGENPAAQGSEFQILGMPADGTFATQVVVPQQYLYAKPAHLSWQQAAALPLAGVTAYRAVFTQGKLQPGEKMLITGVGGGVATWALQYAAAAGASVFVTSSSQEKIDRAVSLGAAAGFNYTVEDWHKAAAAAHGPMDLIIDSAGGSGYAKLVDLAAAGGRIVNYGATTGPPHKLDLFKIFWKQLRLIGSTMGSPADFEAMLQFVTKHQIEPLVDEVFPLSECNAALSRMRESQQFGKIVLDVT